MPESILVIALRFKKKKKNKIYIFSQFLIVSTLRRTIQYFRIAKYFYVILGNIYDFMKHFSFFSFILNFKRNYTYIHIHNHIYMYIFNYCYIKSISVSLKKQKQKKKNETAPLFLIMINYLCSFDSLILNCQLTACYTFTLPYI